MFTIQKFGEKKIITQENLIGVVVDASMLNAHRNQSVFADVELDEAKGKFILTDGSGVKTKIDTFDVKFFPHRDEITLVSRKNVLRIPFKKNFKLKEIKDGIAYYYCESKKIYLLKDIKKNSFLRQAGNKFFTYWEQQGSKKKWYTGETAEPLVLLKKIRRY